MKGFLAALFVAALVAVFFFHKAVKARAFSDDATYGGAIRSIFAAKRH